MARVTHGDCTWNDEKQRYELITYLSDGRYSATILGVEQLNDVYYMCRFFQGIINQAVTEVPDEHTTTERLGDPEDAEAVEQGPTPV